MTLKILACSFLLAAASALPAAAADYIRTAPPAAARAVPPVCGASAVLGAIDRNFDYRAARYLHAGLDIVDLRHPRLLSYRPSDATHLVGRTWCRATAVLNDHRRRAVWYLVETTMGFAGIGDNVEYCVAGLDPWRVYGAHCTSVRP